MYDPPSSDVSVPTPRRKRTVLWVAIGIAGAVAVFVSIAATDDRLDPAAEAFFYGAEPGPADSERVEFAIIGLSAPLGVTDIHAYGLDLVRRARAETARTEALAELQRPDTEIGFKGESNALRCWYLDLEPEDRESCATREEVTRMLKDNSTMLDRYQSLIAYRSSGFDIWSRATPSMMPLQHLHLTRAALLAQEGRIADALDLWSNELSFLRAHASQPSTLINRLIVDVQIRWNIGFLETLLLRQPALTTNDLDTITASVLPRQASDWNLDGVMRAEFSLFDQSVCFHPDAKPKGDDHCLWTAFPNRSGLKANTTVNGIHAFAKRFLAVSKRPPAEIGRACEEFVEDASNRETPSIRQELFNPVGHELLVVFLTTAQGCTSLINMHKRDANFRLLSAWALAYRAKLEGRDPQTVLQALPEKLRDPFSGEPPKWNRSKGELTFPESEGFDWPISVPLAP